MAAALKETDPEEGAAIDVLARRLAGREYFLDPRVFNYPQVRTTPCFFFVSAAAGCRCCCYLLPSCLLLL